MPDIFELVKSLGFPIGIAVFLVFYFVQLNKKLESRNEGLLQELGRLRSVFQETNSMLDSYNKLLRQNEVLVEAIQERERQSLELVKTLVDMQASSKSSSGRRGFRVPMSDAQPGGKSAPQGPLQDRSQESMKDARKRIEALDAYVTNLKPGTAKIHKETIHRQVVMIVIQGDLDLSFSLDFKQVQDETLESPEVRLVLVDLHLVRMIDSTGLASLLQLRMSARKKDVAVALVRPSPSVEGVLQQVGLERVLHVFEDVDSALKAFAIAE